MTRILVVEDNDQLAYGLRNNLEIEGYEVEVASDGRAALDRARSAEHDLILLDLMLPGMDGLDVLRRLRKHGIEVPVLILTARDQEADKVRGLRLGADDYLTKPFGVLELLARVEALLRRASPGTTSRAGGRALERFGQVEVSRSARVVRRRDEVVAMTPKELDLLLALLDRDGGVASREELLRDVWGQTEGATRTVDTHIAELRRKLEERPSVPRHILTVRKVGYRLERQLQRDL